MTMIQAFPSGGSGKGGHTILDNGTAITERDTLNLIDFDITDDSTDEETDIAAHRLTSAELDDIVSAVPNGYSNQPIIYDERGTEYVIGKYIKSDGTIVPLYQKTYTGTLHGQSTARHYINIADLSGVGITKVVGGNGAVKEISNGYYKILNVSDGGGGIYTVALTDTKKLSMLLTNGDTDLDYTISIQYIKN